MEATGADFTDTFRILGSVMSNGENEEDIMRLAGVASAGTKNFTTTNSLARGEARPDASVPATRLALSPQQQPPAEKRPVSPRAVQPLQGGG